MSISLLALSCSSHDDATAANGGASANQTSDTAPDAGGVATKPFPGAAALPKFQSPLPVPPVWVPKSDGSYAIDVREAMQQVLPDGYPKTKVYAYGGPAKRRDGTVDPSFRAWPSATFEATRGTPIKVTWTNALDGVAHMFPVDPTICWADPNHAGMAMPPYPAFPPGIPSAQSPIPIVTHLHGGEVASTSDGFPTDWVPPGQSMTDEFPNAQRPTTLWYHDHSLGMTRLNVLAGLAGFYLIRDPEDPIAPALPSGAYEIPIVIQDRSFNDDGSIQLSASGSGSMHHPYWVMEYYGDVNVVNGRAWPRLDAEARAYRFRLLNGSNARFYNLKLVDEADPGAPIEITQIGSDGGYLPSPVSVSSLLLAPAERADVIVDLSKHAGRSLRFVNDAAAPYPAGWSPDPETTGKVFQIRVAGGPVTPPPPLPSTLDTIAALTPDAPARTLTLVEPNDESGQPLTMALNGQHWDAPVSETPRVGSTEEWRIVNLGDEAHPVHLHLVQFQVVSRQGLDVNGYLDEWTKLNGSPEFPVMTEVKSLDPAKYLKGSPRGPEANERGWKDTAVAHLGEVLTLRVRFAPASTAAGAVGPGKNLFPFDPTQGPGYVWHCHILEHEDNEMMRPYKVLP